MKREGRGNIGNKGNMRIRVLRGRKTEQNWSLSVSHATEALPRAHAFGCPPTAAAHTPPSSSPPPHRTAEPPACQQLSCSFYVCFIATQCLRNTLAVKQIPLFFLNLLRWGNCLLRGKQCQWGGVSMVLCRLWVPHLLRLIGLSEGGG